MSNVIVIVALCAVLGIPLLFKNAKLLYVMIALLIAAATVFLKANHTLEPITDIKNMLLAAVIFAFVTAIYAAYFRWVIKK